MPGPFGSTDLTRKALMLECRMEFPAWAWPEGYPIYYLNEEGDVVCPQCARNEENYIVDLGPEDCAKQIIAFDVYYEGPTLICCECGTGIDSAYGDPEAEAAKKGGE